MNQFRLPRLLYKRRLKTEQTKEFITVIAGARRVGKSYYLYGIMEHLDPDAYLYFNLEDESFENMTTLEFGKLIDAKLQEGRITHIFLDEVQALAKWHKVVRRLFEQKQYYIYITGSSSHMLSMDIDTVLRGRCLTYEMFPFDYREILENNLSPETYRKKGGLIQSWNLEDPDLFRHDYKSQIVKADIFERFGIRNRNIYDWIINYFCVNSGSYTSYRRLVDIMASSGQKASLETVIDYIQFIQSSYFVRGIQLFTRSQSQKIVNPKKYYPLDHSFVTGGVGRELEALVYNNLLTRGHEITYGKNGSEIDFVLSPQPLTHIPIQVCTTMDSEKTAEREVRAVIDFFTQHYYLSNKTGYILTDGNYESTETIGDIAVHIQNWKTYFAS